MEAISIAGMKIIFLTSVVSNAKYFITQDGRMDNGGLASQMNRTDYIIHMLLIWIKNEVVAKSKDVCFVYTRITHVLQSAFSTTLTTTLPTPVFRRNRPQPVRI